jgi:hypothetical protein
MVFDTASRFGIFLALKVTFGILIVKTGHPWGAIKKRDRNH